MPEKEIKLRLDNPEIPKQWVHLPDPVLTPDNTEKYDTIVLHRILDHHKDSGEEATKELRSKYNVLLRNVIRAIYAQGNRATADAANTAQTEQALGDFLEQCKCFQSPTTVAKNIMTAVEFRFEERGASPFFMG